MTGTAALSQPEEPGIDTASSHLQRLKCLSPDIVTHTSRGLSITIGFLMDPNVGAILEGLGNSTPVVLPNKGNARDQTINVIAAVVIIVAASIVATVVAVLIRKRLQKQKQREAKAKIAAGISRIQDDF